VSKEFIFGNQTQSDVEECPDGWTLNKIENDDDDQTVVLTYTHETGGTCVLTQEQVGQYNYTVTSIGGNTFTDEFDLPVMAFYDAQNSMKSYSLGCESE